MSVHDTLLPPASRGPRLSGLGPRRFAQLDGRLVTGAICLCAAALAAHELAAGSLRLAVAFSLIPLAIWLITNPTVPLVLLGLSLPMVISLTGNNSGSGTYNVAASDLVMVLVLAGIALDRSSTKPVPVLRYLRPVAWPLIQYAAVMAIVVAAHLDFREVAKTGQRFELYLVPIVIGAFAALTGNHIRVLKAYVIACAVLAVAFPFVSFGIQHNPAGQFIGNAILVLLGVRALRRYYPCFVVLVPGLIYTLSRGAILATALGVGLILLLQASNGRLAVKRALPILLAAVIAFTFAPASVRDRLTTYSAGYQQPGQFAILLREEYAKDAHRIIAAHPWTGVGVGNYYQADLAFSQNPVLDPHNVLLLQQAEGGYLLLGSFILLMGGVLFALVRMRKVDIATAAAGVLAATAFHGLVDVYWVRGTPVLGWLLVGMACGVLFRMREDSPEPGPVP